MNSYRKLGVGALPVAALLACSVLAYQHFHAKGSRNTAAGHGASTAHEDAPERARADSLVTNRDAVEAWAVGTHRVYATEFRSTLMGDDRTPEGTLEIRGTALLDLTSEVADEFHVALRAKLSDLFVGASTPGAAVKDLSGALTNEMSRPFSIRLRPDGHIDSVSVDRDVRGLGCNVLKTLVASLTFVGPAGTHRNWKAWTTRESDQNGIFRAEYTEIEPSVFRKRKLEYSYLEVASLLKGQTSRPVAITSEAVIRRAPSGALESVESTEHMQVPIGNGSYQSDSRLVLRLKREEKTAVALAALDPSRMTSLLLYANRPPGQSAQVDVTRKKRELVNGASVKTLLDELTRIPATRENQQARWDATKRLTALLDLEPDKIALVGEALLKKPSAADSEMLLAAISDSSAPEAQAMLAKLARDPDLDSTTQVAATTHLGLQEKPTAETLTNLTQLANGSDSDMRNAAALALGSAARSVKESDPTSKASDRAVDELETAFNHSSDAPSRQVYLDGLGNAGAATSLPLIEEALHDPDPSIRKSAAEALRFIPGPEADELIIAALGDPDMGVRSGALVALRARRFSIELVEAVCAELKSEREPLLRGLAIDALRRNLSEFRERIAPVLELIRDHDPDEHVRAAAAAALEGPAAAL